VGSWANSVHVRHDDNATVADSIRGIMLASGYQPTDEAPDPDDWGVEAGLRAVRVAEAREGWVGIVDNDVAELAGLAAALSDELGACAIAVLVNDSDSWHYILFDRGDLVDEFNSDEEGDLEDFEPGGLAAMVSVDQVAELQQRLSQRTQELQQRMQEAMTPELREMQVRWQAGQMPTQEEMASYGEWMKTGMPDLMAEMQKTIAEISPGLGSVMRLGQAGGQLHDAAGTDQGETGDVAGEADGSEMVPHAEHLRPLLAPGVDAAEIQHALAARSVFAEEDLRRFLPLLGIGAVWADLSYRYWAEFTPDELAAKGVRVAAHLIFET